MNATTENPLARCETLMLDMDGTLLDLAFDNYIWLELVPSVFAETKGMSTEAARETLFRTFRELQGTLDWYCLDHWSERLQIDVMALHREHRSRIRYLPGAETFLRQVGANVKHVLLVTNSHVGTLELKAESTGLLEHIDRAYSSHDFGHPKEDQAFWQNLEAAEAFDPDTTVFIDDNASVLASAERYGIKNLLQITQPDTSGRTKQAEFPALSAVADLV